MTRLRAHKWAALLLDEGTIEEHLTEVVSGDPLAWPGYPELRERSDGDEGCRVYTGNLGGHAAVLVAFDFWHLGGSMGAGVGGRVAGAFDLARERRLPVVTVAATGGARMQEGMVALAQMVRTTVAARTHAAAGLLQVSVTTAPTTGGVYASFLSQADLLVAEPDAYVGFAGPRVVAALSDGEVAPDVNTAQWAHERGLVDAVVPRDELRAWLSTALAVAQPPRCVEQTPQRPLESTHLSGWGAVEAARAADRPRAREYLGHCTDVTRLHGDRTGGTDPGTIAALARLHGRPLGLIGLDRAPVQPAGYRTGWRVLDTAGRLGLPVLTLVDTPGADATTDDRGLVHAISDTFARLLAHPAPTVALVIGEGGSGGALALGACDRVLIQERAIFSVIAPEGAAAILHRDASRAPAVAELLKLTATDLLELGIADAIVPDDPAAALAAATAHLDELSGLEADALREARWLRWGTMGA